MNRSSLLRAGVTAAGRVSIALAGFLGLFQLLGTCGPSLPEVRKLWALTVLVLGIGWAKATHRGWSTIVGASILGLPMVLGDPTLAALAFASAWALLFPDVRGLGLTLLFASTTELAAELVPALRIPHEWAARALTSLSPGAALDAGPTTLGLVPATVAATAITIATFLAPRRLALLALSLAIVLVLTLHLLAVGSSTAVTREAAGLVLVPLTATSVALAVIAALACGLSMAPLAATRPPRRFVALLAGSCMALLLGTPFFATGPSTLRVVFWNEGGLDWERPVYGRYELFSNGMFGLLPDYMRRDGITPQVVSGGELTDEMLVDADVFVLINCPRRWTVEECAVVRRFLGRGRGVLALGDHTNVFGLQDGFDTLLAEHGIRFRFDSAYHVEQPWEASARVARHPATTSIPGGFNLSHSIGASLDLSPWVVPLVSAPYAFSDLGSPTNFVGSFLGNYCYEQGERLGDLDLVAWRDVGKGKLLVYGDTSAFQNSALSSTYHHHVASVLRWLARPVALLESSLGRCIAAVMLLVGLIGAARRSRSDAPAFVAALTMGLFATTCASRWTVPTPRLGHDALIVDQNQGPCTGHYNAGMNAVGPLYTYSTRSGLLPYDCRTSELTKLSPARAIVHIAPTRRFDSDYVERLLDFQEDGGVVVLAVDGDQTAASEPFLHAIGLDVAPVPLGKLPPQHLQSRDDLQPRFASAWPVCSWSPSHGRGPLPDRPDLVSLYRRGEFTVVLFARRGKGGTLLIGDGRFFSAQNTEGMWGHWPGNARFLHDVLQEFLRTDATLVSPETFSSPTKPQ